jgi:hypothetical protein
MRAWEGRYEQMVSDAADAWSSAANRLACGGTYPPFWLYYRPAGSGDGALYMVPEGMAADPSWELGDSQPYRCGMNRDTVRARVHSVARRLPILGTAVA